MALRRVPEIWNALEESVKLQSHYAALLNQYDGGNRIGFADAEAWCNRLDELNRKKGATALVD